MGEYKYLIRKRIKEKFKTIENFSRHMEIPRTTINFILKNGISSSNYEMVNKVLKELDIYSTNNYPFTIDERLMEVIKIYNSLDEFGKHTVSAVAETEYNRIKPKPQQDNNIIAAYGSISSNSSMTEDEKIIFDLVRKIKKKDSPND